MDISAIIKLMEHSSKLSFDPQKGRIYFNGGCDEVRDVCGAVCCRLYGVDLYEEERVEGLYDHDLICGLNGLACSKTGTLCMNRRYVLRKKEDGSCVYLDASNKCGIYERRPRACRDFHCDLGWDVVGAVRDENYQKIISDSLKETFKMEMKFALNPASKVKTIFYSTSKKEAVFVMEPPAKCGYMPVKHVFTCPGISDKILLFIYGSFDGEKSLGEIQLSVSANFPAVTEDIFMEVVTMFFRQGLLAFRHAKSAERGGEPHV